MGKGNCAVVACTNSTYKLNIWKKQTCSEHGVPHEQCVCQQPFKLFFFPSKLRNAESRARWVKAMKRESKSKTKWEPCDSDRVCSAHFVDGEPTLSNPDPSVSLGYELSCKTSRRTLQRNPLPPPAKRQRTDNQQQQYNQKENLENLSADTSSLVDIGESCNNAASLSYLLFYAYSFFLLLLLLLSPTSSALPDHSYAVKSAEKIECEKCLDQGEVIKSLVKKVNKLTIQMRKHTFGKNVSKFSYKNISTDSKMRFYTGFTSIAQFEAIFRLLQPYLPKVKYWRGTKRVTSTKVRKFTKKTTKILCHRDEFLLTLMRLRLGLLTEDLADRFGISPATCSNTFTTWVKVISRILGNSLINWLPPEPIRQNMPQSFKKMGYHKCRVILDCTEIFIERPKSLAAQATTWSDYKSHNTIKVLVGISPSGYITFLSDCYGGRVSDKYIVQDSGCYVGREV